MWRININLVIINIKDVNKIVNNLEEQNELNSLTIKEHLLHYLNLGFSKQDAIKFVCADRKIKKSEVYKESINL